MKIGIISNNYEGPVAKALEQVYKALTGGEIERISMAEFQPQYVSQKSLDALLIEGRNNSDEGFAIAVRRNTPDTTKICYFRIYHTSSSQELQEHNIHVLNILDGDLREKFTNWMGGS